MKISPDPSGGVLPNPSWRGAASLRIHDAVARGYNSADGIIGRKNRVFLEAMALQAQQRIKPWQVVDLGVGDGALLQALQALPLPAEFTGLDISPAMLALASDRLSMKPVLARAEQAASHLPQGHYDLVLAHFILAYVPLEALLQQASLLLAEGGVLSLVTSTLEGTQAVLQQMQGWREQSWHPLRRWVPHAVDRAIGLSHVPADLGGLRQGVEAAGLRLREVRTLTDTVVFGSSEEAYRFLIDEGWGVNILQVLPWLPLPVSRALVRRCLDLFDYPLQWQHNTEMLWIDRPGREPAGAGPLADAPQRVRPGAC